MSEDLFNRFNAMIEGLKTNPNIEIVHLKWRPGIQNEHGTKYFKNFIRKELKEEVPDTIIEVGRICNNTHVCWKGKWQEKTYWGEFFLPSSMDIYREPPGGIVIEKSFGGELKYSNKISVIDSHPEIGDMHATLLDRSKPALPLWFYYKGNAYAMSLSYTQYLEKLCITRGIALWPLHFATYKDDADNAAILGEKLAEFTKALQHFFPDADTASLK